MILLNITFILATVWPWWNAAGCCISSGSSLFAKIPIYKFPVKKHPRDIISCSGSMNKHHNKTGLHHVTGPYNLQKPRKNCQLAGIVSRLPVAFFSPITISSRYSIYFRLASHSWHSALVSLFDALYPSQQFFSHVRMISGLHGLNMY